MSSYNKWPLERLLEQLEIARRELRNLEQGRNPTAHLNLTRILNLQSYISQLEAELAIRRRLRGGRKKKQELYYRI